MTVVAMRWKSRRTLLVLGAMVGLMVVGAGLSWKRHSDYLRELAEQEKAKAESDPEQESDRARVEDHMRTIGYVQ